MKKPACFSTKIDLALSEKLKHDLIAQDFSLKKPAHTLFQAQKKGISLTLYESGALTVQGKEKDAFIEFYLEPEILQNFSYSYPQVNLDLSPRIGVDEAGKGDFFGPLCVVGVFANASDIQKLVELGVRDSKTFSDKSILLLGKKIQALISFHSISLFPPKYNELYAKMKNLNYLLAWGHVSCVEALFQKSGCSSVIIDRFAQDFVIENMVKKKKLNLEIKQVVRAESDVVVAAASILARMYFLQGLEKLSEECGILLPKGASSKVFEAGKTIFLTKGIETLKSVCKTHFKTFQEIGSEIR